MVSCLHQGQVPPCSTFAPPPLTLQPERPRPRGQPPTATARLTQHPLPQMPATITRPSLQQRLGLPNNRPMDGPTDLQLLKSNLPQTALSAVTAVVGDLFNGSTPYLAPGVFIPAGSGQLITAPTLVPRWFGMLLVDQAPLPHQGVFTGVNYLSGAATSAIGIFAHGDIRNGVLAMLGKGYLNLGTSLYVRHPNNLQVMSLNISAWRDFLGVGMQYVYSDPISHLLAIGGLQVGKSARRDLTNMGVYQGLQQDALVEAHGQPAGTPLRRVELRSRTGESFGLRLGGGSITLAGMLRLELQRGRETAYRTFLSLDQAHNLLFEGKGLRHFFHNKARALGWAQEPLPPPALDNPEALHLGDEVARSTTRSGTLGALLGNLALWAGCSCTVRNDLEIAVRKFAPHQVEVILTPVHVRAHQIYGVQPFGPHLSLRSAHAEALRSGLTFDLREPVAAEAFAATLEGHPPGLEGFTVQAHLQQASTDLASTLQQVQATLPAGVRYSFLNLFSAGTADGGGGLKWLIFPQEWLPKGWETGFTWHHQVGAEDQAVTDGQTTITTRTRSHTHICERGWNGLRTTMVQAAERWEHCPGAPSKFIGLTLQATLGDTHTTARSFNQHFVNSLNRHFGTRLLAALRPHRREDRQTQITRVLGAAEVERLAELLRISPSPARYSQIARAAEGAKASFHALYAMLEALAQTADISARNAILQTYVQHHGICAFAALHRLLGGNPEALVIRSASSIYDVSLAKADLLTAQYLHAADDDEDGAALASRWRALDRGLGDLQRAIDDVADDSLLTPEARQGMLHNLGEARDKLHTLLPSSVITLHTLRAFLTHHPLWQRSWQRRALEATEDVSPLLREAWGTVQAWGSAPSVFDPRAWLERWNQINDMCDRLQARLSVLREVRYLLPPPAYAAQERALNAALEALIGPPPYLPRGGLLDVSWLPKEVRDELAARLPRWGRGSALRAALA